MSERVRKSIGIVLLTAAVLLAVSGLLPFPHDSGVRFTGNGNAVSSVPHAVHLSSTDPFNTEDAGFLCSFPGIGEATASAILAEREANGPFFYPEDLISVSGIGLKKLEKLRPFLSLDEVGTGE